MHAHWAHVGRGAAGLGAAMGIGRFAYTPILPLMTTQAALSPQAAGRWRPRTTSDTSPARWQAPPPRGWPDRPSRGGRRWSSWWPAWRQCRCSPTSLAGCCCGQSRDSPARWCSSSPSTGCWITCRPHLPGWGFGGVGARHRAVGCAGADAARAAGWQGAWWTAAALAAVLGAGAWTMRGRSDAGADVPQTPPPSSRHANRWFAVLFVSYTLEGIGYIIAGTFLVAAIKQNSSGWLGNGAWLFVGLAAVPSAALWAWLCARWSHPTLLAGALLLAGVRNRTARTGSGGRRGRSSGQSCSAARSSGSARWPWRPAACSDSPAPWRC